MAEQSLDALPMPFDPITIEAGRHLNGPTDDSPGP